VVRASGQAEDEVVKGAKKTAMIGTLKKVVVGCGGS
jgi:hypothetical protein